MWCGVHIVPSAACSRWIALFLSFFTQRHVTGWLVYTLCPACGMVFTLCLVRHVVGGLPLFFSFFYPAPCNWVASVHIVPSVPCNWAVINPTTRPRVHNYYTRPSAPWSAWHMCWKIIHSMSTWAFLKCPIASQIQIIHIFLWTTLKSILYIWKFAFLWHALTSYCSHRDAILIEYTSIFIGKQI